MPVLKNREQLSIKLHEMIKIPIVETNIKPGVRCPYIGFAMERCGATGGVMGLCPIWPLGQRTLAGTGPFSPLVGQRLCAVGAATGGGLGRCALEKGV